MRIHLIGTGSADGWPNPFCRCPSCESERADGRSRAATSVIVDDRVLIDCGPTAAMAAVRFGVSLAEVEHLLITHGHPDHLAPDFLLWRSWVGAAVNLHVWAPAEAIARCRDWVGPKDPVIFHAIVPGDRLDLDTTTGVYSVTVIAASHHHGNQDVLAMEAVLFDLTAPDGTTMFYATDTGQLKADQLDALVDRAFDHLLLDETFGDKPADDHGNDIGHLNLQTFPETLTNLRRVRAINDNTDVIAIHLSHFNPPTATLSMRLAAYGARVVDDGTIVVTNSAGGSPTAPHHLVIGGARSGKSTFAEQEALSFSEVCYLATGYPINLGRSNVDWADADWRARVTAHQSRRPAHWLSVETIDLAPHIDAASSGSCLIVDCLGLWVTRILDESGGWSDERVDQEAAVAELLRRAADLGRALDQTSATVILVTNEVGLGVVPATPTVRLFRDALGRVNSLVARHCPKVTLMVAGRAVPLPDHPQLQTSRATTKEPMT